MPFSISYLISIFGVLFWLYLFTCAINAINFPFVKFLTSIGSSFAFSITSIIHDLSGVFLCVSNFSNFSHVMVFMAGSFLGFGLVVGWVVDLVSLVVGLVSLVFFLVSGFSVGGGGSGVCVGFVSLTSFLVFLVLVFFASSSGLALTSMGVSVDTPITI